MVKNLPVMQETQSCGFGPWVGKIPWRRIWQCTLVLLPGESHRQRSLLDFSPWTHKESDMTEMTEHSIAHMYIHAYVYMYKYIYI